MGGCGGDGWVYPTSEDGSSVPKGPQMTAQRYKKCCPKVPKMVPKASKMKPDGSQGKPNDPPNGPKRATGSHRKSFMLLRLLFHPGAGCYSGCPQTSGTDRTDNERGHAHTSKHSKQRRPLRRERSGNARGAQTDGTSAQHGARAIGEGAHANTVTGQLSSRKDGWDGTRWDKGRDGTRVEQRPGRQSSRCRRCRRRCRQ